MRVFGTRFRFSIGRIAAPLNGVGLAAMGLLLTAVLLPSPARAAAAAPAGPPSAPHVLRVEVVPYINNMSQIDMAKAQYTADFYLDLRCLAPCNGRLFRRVSLEVMNGSLRSVDLQEHTDTERVYRIQALLDVDMDLHNYPFDHEDLTIALEDRTLDATQLRLVGEPRGGQRLDPAVKLEGWLDNPAGWWTETRLHTYPIFVAPGNQYSRYVFHLPIHRPLVASLLKGLLPPLIIVISGFLSFFLSSDDYGKKIAIFTAALTSVLLYHIALSSSIPPVAYPTYADKFMYLNYAALLLSLVATVVLAIRARHGMNEVRSRYLSGLFGVGTVSFWALAQALTAVVQFH